jgi:hypothetical protein
MRRLGCAHAVGEGRRHESASFPPCARVEEVSQRKRSCLGDSDEERHMVGGFRAAADARKRANRCVDE